MTSPNSEVRELHKIEGCVRELHNAAVGSYWATRDIDSIAKIIVQARKSLPGSTSSPVVKGKGNEGSEQVHLSEIAYSMRRLHTAAVESYFDTGDAQGIKEILEGAKNELPRKERKSACGDPRLCPKDGMCIPCNEID